MVSQSYCERDNHEGRIYMAARRKNRTADDLKPIDAIDFACGVNDSSFWILRYAGRAKNVCHIDKHCFFRAVFDNPTIQHRNGHTSFRQLLLQELSERDHSSALGFRYFPGGNYATTAEHVPLLRKHDEVLTIRLLFGNDMDTHAIQLMRYTLALKFAGDIIRVNIDQNIDNEIFEGPWKDVAIKDFQSYGFYQKSGAAHQ